MKEYQLLIVEDMLDQVNVLIAWLKQAKIPIKCHIASSLEEATDLILKQKMDTILLDLGLPDSEGIDTLNKIRQLVDDTPIVIITGTMKDELKLDEHKEAGHIKDFIIKPTDQMQIIVAVTSALLSSIELWSVETCIERGTIKYVHKDLQILRSMIAPLTEVK